MTHDRAAPAGRSRSLFAALLALGFASAAVSAQAQGGRTNSPPTAPPPVPVPVPAVPADKKADYDDAIAKEAAFKKYRSSTPPSADGAIDQSKDFPGLQSYIPK
jgi:hypothetical protein